MERQASAGETETKRQDTETDDKREARGWQQREIDHDKGEMLTQTSKDLQHFDVFTFTISCKYVFAPYTL